MKRSAPKQSFSDILKNDTRPRSRKIEPDGSDDLAKMFDDGMPLPSAKPTPATLGTQGTLSTQGSQPVAPVRDYQKVANSITRNAVPSGLFKGKSKQIYDYLYSRTRGAIVPTRSAQVTRREMMKGAHIGSDKTIRENLLHLRGVGLISWGGEIGAQGGSVYTVYLPEEISTTLATLGSQGSPGHNLPEVPMVESTQGTQGISLDFQRTSGNSKTSFKTSEQNTDDEAFAKLRAAAKEITGKEAIDWQEVDEVLTTELRIAAGRTTVSSVPAFLAEHLRRRLWKKDKRQIEAEASNLEPSTVNLKRDTSNCPDCFGTGMRYHDGDYSKGVERCPHDKLQP
jgi:hypothetical protein